MKYHKNGHLKTYLLKKRLGYTTLIHDLTILVFFKIFVNLFINLGAVVMPAINCFTNVSLCKHEFVLKINIYLLKLTNKKQTKTEKNIFICEGQSKINITNIFY